MMACALAVAQPAASLFPCGSGSRSISTNLPRLPVSGRARSRGAVAKAVQGSSEPSSGSIVKYVKGSLNTVEDVFALAGIGFAAIAALWASINLIEIIDKLPVVPLLFELIGILVAWTFIYGNLLFKPDSLNIFFEEINTSEVPKLSTVFTIILIVSFVSLREEFLNSIKSNASRILGQ